LNLGEIRLLAELAGEKKPVDFWEADYSAALQKARKENKPIFVMLTTEHCGWCRKLEEDTLSHSKIQLFLEPFIKVQVYADKNEEQGNLATKLGAAGYPTLVFLDQNEAVLTAGSDTKSQLLLQSNVPRLTKPPKFLCRRI
jgi:uncharacterized protein YyaL (SSP411 family)